MARAKPFSKRMKTNLIKKKIKIRRDYDDFYLSNFFLYYHINRNKSFTISDDKINLLTYLFHKLRFIR